MKLKVLKETNRSQLTRMWNEVKHEKSEHKGFMYQNKLSYYFLIGLLIVAGGAALGWYFYDPSQIVRIVVAILIVACPCALALSAPFTFGNTMRVLGRNGLYLKNTGVIERLNEVTDIVFDKTGTLTSGSENKIEYFGDELTDEQLAILSSLAGSSTHPLSRAIVFFLNQKGIRGNVDILNWKQRLSRVMHHPGSHETLRMLDNVCSPAVQTVADELIKRGMNVEVNQGESEYHDKLYHLDLTIFIEDEHNFVYQIWPVRYIAPTFSERGKRGKQYYYRLETFLYEGSQDNDLVGYTKEQVINDILDKYERHMTFLHINRISPGNRPLYPDSQD